MDAMSLVAYPVECRMGCNEGEKEGGEHVGGGSEEKGSIK